MDVIIEFAAFVIKFISFLLVISLIIWIFYRPLAISYRLSPDGIDIMLLSFYGKIRYWVLSTIPLDYIRDHTNKYDGT
jgi:hypothetical protein